MSKMKCVIIVIVIILCGCGNKTDDVQTNFYSANNLTRGIETTVETDSGFTSNVKLETDSKNMYITTNDLSLVNYAKVDFNYKDINIDEECSKLILLSDTEAWKYVTNGLFNNYPSESYGSIKSKLVDIHSKNMSSITVPVWYWKNPDTPEDMEKVSTTMTVKVNSKVAILFVSIFTDIYNNSSKPIIDLSDTGMGTWVLRGKSHSDYNTLSAHALGTAIDINPASSYTIDNKTYGNGYGSNLMTTVMFNQLPESHVKYQILYEDSPIVKIFKAYGFYWGGDWSSTKDMMHFSYLGDSSGREKGISNYMEALNEK